MKTELADETSLIPLFQELQQTFYAPLSLWTVHRRYAPNNTCQDPWPWSDDDCARMISQGDVHLQSVDDLHSWIAFRVEMMPRRHALAIGKVPGKDAELLKRLAQSAARTARRLLVIDDLQEQVASSMTQITLDFEQQAYLRALAEQIEICDVTRDVKHVARKTLARLAQVVRSRVLAFVVRGNAESPTTPRVEVRVGEDSITNDECVALATSLDDRLASGPVVLNAGFSMDEQECRGGIENLILVPVEKEGTSIGWLLAVNHIPKPIQEGRESVDGFGTVEAGLMQVSATMLANHGRNISLFREAEELTIAVVRSLVSSIEARDSYTRGHSERVALYAKRLAEKMEIASDECERIYVAGLLHDVGKIGVPDHILQKPGKLTPEEFNEIRKHPDIGYTILKGLERINYVLPGVLYHHERLDGLGYPDGLVGENIPLMARILAVVDAWDAMTSARPYRDGMPTTRAESIIQFGRGSQWDATIVDAFLQITHELPGIAARASKASLEITRVAAARESSKRPRSEVDRSIRSSRYQASEESEALATGGLCDGAS